MDKYYINANAQDNGDHEVHRFDCVFIPKPMNRIDLGYFAHCIWAFETGKSMRPRWKINGCYFWSRDCHTETVAKYTNLITDSGNFEFLVIFGAKIPYFASESVQIQDKKTRQIYFATVSYQLTLNALCTVPQTGVLNVILP